MQKLVKCKKGKRVFIVTRPLSCTCVQVVCGSKYLVRGETARDHVDLLLSSRYWPPVYVSDCARLVALCADMQYPELATRMWGRNQGCFSDPFEKPMVSDCKEIPLYIKELLCVLVEIQKTQRPNQYFWIIAITAI